MDEIVVNSHRPIRFAWSQGPTSWIPATVGPRRGRLVLNPTAGDGKPAGSPQKISDMLGTRWFSPYFLGNGESLGGGTLPKFITWCSVTSAAFFPYEFVRYIWAPDFDTSSLLVQRSHCFYILYYVILIIACDVYTQYIHIGKYRWIIHNNKNMSSTNVWTFYCRIGLLAWLGAQVTAIFPNSSAPECCDTLHSWSCSRMSNTQLVKSEYVNPKLTIQQL